MTIYDNKRFDYKGGFYNDSIKNQTSLVLYVRIGKGK